MAPVSLSSQNAQMHNELSWPTCITAKPVQLDPSAVIPKALSPWQHGLEHVHEKYPGHKHTNMGGLRHHPHLKVSLRLAGYVDL